jgi:hypothetical protein
VSAGAVAARLWIMARRTELPAVSARILLVGGLSAAAVLGLVVLAF